MTASATADVSLCWAGWYRGGPGEPWAELCRCYSWHACWAELTALMPGPESNGDAAVLPIGVRPDSRPSAVQAHVPERCWAGWRRAGASGATTKDIKCRPPTTS